MKHQSKSFSVFPLTTKDYRDNFDCTFYGKCDTEPAEGDEVSEVEVGCESSENGQPPS